jgi:hypothetical protein
VELRTQWNGHIQRLAPSMLFSMQDIDAATYAAAREHGVPMNATSSPAAT